MTDFDSGSCFGPDGRLSQAIPGYEHRIQQERMSAAVWDTLNQTGRLAVEAGTGTGKSLAYLLPAAAWAVANQKRVIISTYTRLLQNQLLTKDVPLLPKLLDECPKAAVAYGQENYLCRFRLEMQMARGLFDTREEARAADGLFNWADKTEDGILLNYPEPLPAALIRRIGRDSAACRGADCPYRRGCFYLKGRRSWEASGILIANHSLFFASVVGAADLLPEYGAVIFDEAHRLEDACVSHFGAEVSQYALGQLLSGLAGPKKGGLSRLLPQRSTARHDLEAAVAACEAEAERFFDQTAATLPQDADRLRLLSPLQTEAPAAAIERLADLLDEAVPDIDDEMLSAELAASARRLHNTAGAFNAFAKLDSANSVYWVNHNGPSRLELMSAPLDVAPMLNTYVYSKEAATILTSATLTVAGSFSFFSERLGLADFTTLLLDSPFDYANHSLLYIPAKLPAPTEGATFARAAAAEIGRVIEHTRGRALVLFTSYDSLNTVFGLMPQGKYTHLCQGDVAPARLLEQFQTDTHSVLFATQSFWQGIDVPGEALSCLIICRLPFEVPDDPRLSAIAEKMREQGIEPFTAYQLPTAVLRFRQGFGRLIRTATDRGIVCVLDRRIIDKPYGRIFLKSLPKGMPVTSKLANVESFFAED